MRYFHHILLLTTLTFLSFCTSKMLWASSFEMKSGLWQIKSTVSKKTPFDGDTEASEYQLKCVDPKDKNILFKMLEDAFEGLNNDQVFNAKSSCETQNNTTASQIKITASCKTPGNLTYTSFLLVHNFNNQHQYSALIHSEHPNGIIHNIKVNLIYLGTCLDEK